MLYICLDIALNKSGLAVLDDNGSIVKTDLFAFKRSEKDYYDKLVRLYSHYHRTFEDILAQNPSGVSLILEDRLKGGWNPKSLVNIEGARVAAFLAFRSLSEAAEVHLYDPTNVKLAVGGRVAIKKEEMHEKLRDIFPAAKKIEYQEDIFDAISLGVCHFSHLSNP